MDDEPGKAAVSPLMTVRMSARERVPSAASNAAEGGSPRDAVDAGEYARMVGARVAVLVEEALEADPEAVPLDPDSMAGIISDLMVNRVGGGSEMADLVAPLWSAERARRELNISRSTMAERRSAGSLLALKPTDADEFFYPVSQFERRDGRVQVKAGLRRFMMALRGSDPWTVAVLMRTPALELGNLTPLDWVRRGRDESTLNEYAEMLVAELAR